MPINIGIVVNPANAMTRSPLLTSSRGMLKAKGDSSPFALSEKLIYINIRTKSQIFRKITLCFVTLPA